MKVTVVGTGYVGLVTGTCFAELGNDVICVDNNSAKVASMKSGKIPIYEPKLEDLFLKNISEGRLCFTTSLAEGFDDVDVVFLALPTPPAENGEADLSHILGVAEEIGPLLKSYCVVVNKSTVPVGTATLVHKAIGNNTKVPFDVVSNPEFLREGFAVDDFMEPDRIVIGSSSDRAKKVITKLYDPFVRRDNPLILMDEASAELTKYAANSFLATKISFMNEVAILCEKLGANVDYVRQGIGADDRIGKRFLFPGIGYGGSCFPKDVWAMHKTSENVGFDFKILEAVRAVNKAQRVYFIDKIIDHYKGDITGKKFAVWGLAFKPDTDDIREAPALDVIKALISKGATVTAYDPVAMNNVAAIMDTVNGFELTGDEYKATEGADALIVATEWEQFRTPNFAKLKSGLRSATIFDGRNIYDPKQMSELGFTYLSVGRPNIDR